MEKVIKSRYATIAIKPKVHDNIKKLAKHSYQTVGGYIEQLIEKEMKQMQKKCKNYDTHKTKCKRNANAKKCKRNAKGMQKLRHAKGMQNK